MWGSALIAPCGGLQQQILFEVPAGRLHLESVSVPAASQWPTLLMSGARSEVVVGMFGGLGGRGSAFLHVSPKAVTTSTTGGQSDQQENTHLERKRLCSFVQYFQAPKCPQRKFLVDFAERKPEGLKQHPSSCHQASNCQIYQVCPERRPDASSGQQPPSCLTF